HAVVPFQCGGRIAVEGRADRVGDADEAHALRVEGAADVAEMVHFKVVSGSAGRARRVCGPPAARACPAWRCRSRWPPRAAPPGVLAPRNPPGPALPAGARPARR